VTAWWHGPSRAEAYRASTKVLNLNAVGNDVEVEEGVLDRRETARCCSKYFSTQRKSPANADLTKTKSQLCLG
jgi:hypothetical protein